MQKQRKIRIIPEIERVEWNSLEDWLAQGFDHDDVVEMLHRYQSIKVIEKRSRLKREYRHKAMERVLAETQGKTADEVRAEIAEAVEKAEEAANGVN